MQKTLSELKAIEKLSSTWTLEMKRKVEKLNCILTESKKNN